MRLLHTSDWHLGRSFHRVGLLEAQAAFADHVVEVVRSEGVDAVLVSGDVYDRALPAPDTVALLSETVRRIVDAGAEVVLSSGNHDSAIRLGFASELLARAGLHIRTRTDSIGTPVLLGDVAVYPLPYLEPSAAADTLGSADRTHAGVLRAAMARVVADRAARPGPAVVMAHAFVTGGATSDSERDISVGGVSAVPPEVFGAVDYVALGHLHGPQRVSETVRYSGSPVALSFSEADHRKGSWLVDLAPGRAGRPATVAVEHIEAPVFKPLARLRGTLEELLSDRRHRAAEGAWCEVTLTDAQRPRGAMERLRTRFPGCLSLRFDGPTPLDSARSYAARVRRRSDLDVCCDFLEHVRGGAGATDAERDLLRLAVEESARARAVHDDEGTAAESVARREQGVA
ncbi:MAG TPA: exonuclease SbcCD subunit D [Segeticoccus sp.]|uniref:exonuclease SbcCD subunit D n=1 Tax=Segeticoccus sp. TaxID=2706531 RepID=UPI002D7E442B|nr:exonuclease SbcCD subunit D [Segeticoccus sp.]HET8602158.1 exonuclease SbcCD subunit D [Segeticoccus sp.]